jgi:uracil-DNA glycosylase
VAQSTVTSSEPETAIELRLALWQPSDELLVCSSVEDSLPDPEQILLLGNILQTMGQGSSQLPQMDVVEWPPYPNMAGGESEVREFLATLIQARIDSKSAKIILLLGDAAAQWLLTPEQQAGVTNGQVDVFGQVTALLVPSLKAYD